MLLWLLVSVIERIARFQLDIIEVKANLYAIQVHFACLLKFYTQSQQLDTVCKVICSRPGPAL